MTAAHPEGPPADFVTGLRPRSDLEARLRAEAAAPLALLGIDLVGLKQTNETDGFLAGDQLLAAAAARLVAATPTARLRVRLGGDELVAVFTGPTATAEADAARATLRSGSDPAIRCGLVTRGPDETPPQLVERLYAAVRAG